MPIYAYRCDECEDIVEARRPIEDRDVELRCVYCGEPRHRVYLPVRFNMNGGGSQQSEDEITSWQFKNLDDKPRRRLSKWDYDKLPRISPDSLAPNHGPDPVRSEGIPGT